MKRQLLIHETTSEISEVLDVLFVQNMSCDAECLIPCREVHHSAYVRKCFSQWATIRGWTGENESAKLTYFNSQFGATISGSFIKARTCIGKLLARALFLK